MANLYITTTQQFQFANIDDLLAYQRGEAVATCKSLVATMETKADWPTYSPEYRAALRTLIAAVSAGDDWTATDERLPERDKEVLCQLRGSGRMVCNSWSPACDQNETWFIERFIAWMPKPQPYKRDSPKEQK